MRAMQARPSRQAARPLLLLALLLVGEFFTNMQVWRAFNPAHFARVPSGYLEGSGATELREPRPRGRTCMQERTVGVSPPSSATPGAL